MPVPPSRLRTVFRACVVTAVREGEAVMAQLIEATRGALAGQESGTRGIAQRNLASDALRLLGRHEAALLKAYPMALLEVFAEGPAAARPRQTDPTGMDFGELALVDDAEVQAQVELSRAQQRALHATDAALAELNALVSAAQGLQRVQPERNPLRPENYIRALQRVVTETGAPAPVRDLWMQHLGELLGPQLVGAYQRAAQALRGQGVEPVGYGVALVPGVRSGYSGYASAYADSGHHSQGMAYGAPSGYARGGGGAGWMGDAAVGTLTAETEEAWLTVGILRQLLAGGDPYAALHGSAYAVEAPTPGLHPAWAEPQVAGVPTHTERAGGPLSAAAAEALHDMAQLERLVGRLAQGAPLSGARPLGAALGSQNISSGSSIDSPGRAAEVVARMVENLAQDARLLPAVQRAVQSLEPAIRKLVRHDPRFFSDSLHPARRLLDELTQRSLAFASPEAPGFAGFIRTVHERVEPLCRLKVVNAASFESVLGTLQAAWDAQANELQARHEEEAQQRWQAQQREALAGRIAADIRTLSGADQVPADVLDFVAGPWADVVALAQLEGPEAADGDPGGYLALVPELFWSAQPALACTDPARLIEAMPHLVATLRTGLQSIRHPEDLARAFLERLTGLHQRALAAVETMPSVPAQHAAEPVPPKTATAPAPPEVEAEFTVGTWVELLSNRRTVRTQLTWTSPQHTLFLFTAPDGSTQSMTRRMRDKLAAQGALRVVPAPPMARATEGGAASAPVRKPPHSR
ncbi:hypothetical protein B2J88_39350 [Rhodococcus sp. SRB_17]|nr:hypothetical protein [Rhodococcus sp. SRB_17]